MVTLTNLFSATAPELTNIIGKFMQWIFGFVGNFGWTVVVFTIILKLILSPLDIWQKKVTLKNNKAMKRMQPKLEKLQKQYANNREMYSQKQMELYKKEGYSMFGACIPMLVTIVVFFIVFQGFYATVRYQNEVITYNLAEKYNELKDTKTQDEIDKALAEEYSQKIQSFYWVKNIFMPDTWADVIPSQKTYEGKGLGKLDAKLPTNINKSEPYLTLVNPAINKYNKKDWKDFKNWNGYLILPLIAIILNLFSSKLMQANQPTPPMQMGADGKPTNNAATMKMMQYMMPLMIGVFALFYSSAFTIYLIVSALFTTITNVIYNKIASIKEKKEDMEAMNRGRR